MDFEDLNFQQKVAVEFNGNHVLVLAGAGTGKTKTIVSRAAYLISKGIAPRNIQILSFTRKSAREIVERVKSMFPSSEAKLLNGSTFHAWCTTIIKSNPKIFSFSKYTLLEPEDQVDAFRLILGKNKIIIEETRIKPYLFRDVYSYMVNVKCNLTEAIRHIIFNNQNNDETNKLIKENKQHFEVTIKEYIRYKNSHQQLDYDDILQGVVSVLNNNPHAQKYIASQYEHILVDEMQDTNPLQWALLSLFQPYCHLFCVGDDAQSIYAFRGADFRNVHSFKEKVLDAEVLKLEENYRSTQEILDVSNWLLEQSPLDYNKHLKAVRGRGEKPILKHFETDREEANWISDDIIQSITSEGKSYKDHMILSRTGFGLKAIEIVCISKKIPYQIFGGIQLLESSHVRDVLSVLKIIANIHDELSWMRYLQVWEGIGVGKASPPIEQIANCKTIDECITTLKTNNLKRADITDTLEAIKDLNTSPHQALEIAVKHMQTRLSKLYEDWSKRALDFPLLAQIAQSHSTINEFITEFVLDPSLKEGNIKEGSQITDVVTLSTIHSAKGLEADSCYVINVSPGIYPSIKSISQGKEEIEEERRCLYVALTRAKNKLVVTRKFDSIRTTQDGRTDDSQVIESYFFNSLPDSLFDNTVSQEEPLGNTSDYNGGGILWTPWNDFNFE